jgi:hypothetical protein
VHRTESVAYPLPSITHGTLQRTPSGFPTCGPATLASDLGALLALVRSRSESCTQPYQAEESPGPRAPGVGGPPNRRLCRVLKVANSWEAALPCHHGAFQSQQNALDCCRHISWWCLEGGSSISTGPSPLCMTYVWPPSVRSPDRLLGFEFLSSPDLNHIPIPKPSTKRLQLQLLSFNVQGHRQVQKSSKYEYFTIMDDSVTRKELGTESKEVSAASESRQQSPPSEDIEDDTHRAALELNPETAQKLTWSTALAVCVCCDCHPLFSPKRRCADS